MLSLPGKNEQIVNLCSVPRRERLTQLEMAFHASKASAIRKARVILVDDVVTTGTTLEAAAKVLRAAGAARIDAIVFAQP